MDEKEKLYEEFMQTEGMLKLYKGLSESILERNFFFYRNKLVNIVDTHTGFTGALLNLARQLEMFVYVYVHRNLFKKKR